MTRILQLTDLHLVSPSQRVSGRLDTYRLLENAIARIAEDLHKIGPVDALVVTGDISDRGDLESYQLFRGLIETLGLPYYLLPGNHDDRTQLLNCFADCDYLPRSGPVNWVQHLGNIRLIGLDTLLPGKGGGELEQQTLRFLAEELHSAPQIPTLLALHHPPFSCGVHFMDAIGLRQAERLADILEQTSTELRIICGHLHAMVIGDVAGRVALSSPSTCSTFDVDYRQDAPVGFTTRPGGYMVHDWNGCFRSTCIPLAEGTGPHPF